MNIYDLDDAARTPFNKRDPFTAPTPASEPTRHPPTVEPDRSAGPELGL